MVNQKDSTVSPIDLRTNRAVRTLRTGAGPHEVAYSPLDLDPAPKGK